MNRSRISPHACSNRLCSSRLLAVQARPARRLDASAWRKRQAVLAQSDHCLAQDSMHTTRPDTWSKSADCARRLNATVRISIPEWAVPSNTRGRPRDFAEEPSDKNHNIDRADYGDYGSDDLRTMGGIPRGNVRAGVSPQWTQDTEHSDELFRVPRAPHPRERSVAEAFGYHVPHTYPYSGVASEARRGRFFGRGPKGYQRSDERIRDEISDRLMTHPDIDASEMEVQVSNGVVTLTGNVEDRHEKRLAEYIAEDALGVNDVENRLKIRHGFWATLTGEKATERELPTRAAREPSTASRRRGRANAARGAARRDAEAR